MTTKMIEATGKMRFSGKLCLTPDMPLHPACFNEPGKEKCTMCENQCFSPECCGDHCDAHQICQCIGTECMCQGRYSH